MTRVRPRIVVTLPARTVEEARKQIGEARGAGADYAEVRIDRWTPAEMRRVEDLFPSSLPLIGTLRSQAEGGAGPDDPGARETVLRSLAGKPFTFIDLECARDRSLEGTIAESGVGIVLSSHLSGAASLGDVRARLAMGAPHRGLLKVVLPSTFERALVELLPLFESVVEPRPIFLLSGPCGPLWRGWTGRLGVPWVFAALPESVGVVPVEPAQVPADRLARFLADPEAPIFVLLGQPVGHSRSPAIHHAWMRRAGRVGLYVPLDLGTPAEFRRAIGALPSRGVRGANVTHPWKALAFECSTERSVDSIAIGGANCLTFNEGRILAHNTDLGAVERRLRELYESGAWDGDSLTVLGGGGAARATLVAAHRRGAQATVYVRRASESAALETEFQCVAGDRENVRPAALVVHATDVGRAGRGLLELPLSSLLTDRTYLLDWVYDPEVATVAEAARNAGSTYEDGRRLLVYQAAESYRAWWGEPPDAESVRVVLVEAGCEA